MLLILASLVLAVDGSTVATGNVLIEGRVDGVLSTPSHPLLMQATQLNCGAQKLGEQVELRAGEFTRSKDNKKFPATIKGRKAILEIGKAPLGAAGKYTCHVHTVTDDETHGNLFIYLRPVFKFEREVRGHRKGEFETQIDPIKVPSGSDVTLHCPAFGYPEPFTRWEKDGQPIEHEKVEYDGHDVTLKEVSASDAGVYSCHADSSYPIFAGGPSLPHTSVLHVPLTLI